jgi:hypothetical protein
MKMKNGLHIDKDGTKEWFLNGEFHREDGPAVEWIDGSKFWYKDGKEHREDGPAVEWHDGNKEWFLNDKSHRVDGPAIECADGHKEWYLNDKLVYSKNMNKLSQYDNLSESFKMSIIKYELSR